MKDPVQTTSGHTFERAAIEYWFRDHDTNPLTNEKIEKTLTSNIALRYVIETYLKEMERVTEPPVPDKIPLGSNITQVKSQALVWQEGVMAHCHGKDTRNVKLSGGKYHVLFNNSNLLPFSYAQVHWRVMTPEGGDPVQSGQCELRNMPAAAKKCWIHIHVPENLDGNLCELHMQFTCCTWFSDVIKFGHARVNVSILEIV